jgi:hypothetical protein
VEQTQGQWCVRDNNRVLFGFATHESDARNALAIIHKYGFTQIGFLGDTGPSMLVLLGPANADTSDSNMPHLAHHSPLRDAKPLDAKATANDANPLLSPAIPPLRTAAPDMHKEAAHPFGNLETVEVLPVHEKATKVSHPTPPPLPPEWVERTPFDFRFVQVRQEGNQHVLVANGVVLARFTTDHDARVAETTIRHYRFTELDRVGKPQPFASFFLCNGEAPVGPFAGGDTERFEPQKLRVAQLESRWAILAEDKPLIWFGARPEEARVMLDVIQREQFDRLCHIGDERGLTFFVRSR